MQLDDNAIVTEDGKRSDMSNSVTNEERVWYFEDHEINFVTVGDGNTNVLCLSAGTPDYRDLSRASWHNDWGTVLESYDRQKFHLLAFDPVGCGKSLHPNRAKFMEEERTKQIGLHERDAEIANLIMQKKMAMGRYSIMAKNDAVDVALRLAHHTSGKAVDRLILWGNNAYVTQWELDNAAKVCNATLVIRTRHRDSRGLIRKCQADYLARAMPNASVIDHNDDKNADPFVLLRDEMQAFLASA